MKFKRGGREEWENRGGKKKVGGGNSNMVQNIKGSLESQKLKRGTLCEKTKFKKRKKSWVKKEGKEDWNSKQQGKNPSNVDGNKSKEGY